MSETRMILKLNDINTDSKEGRLLLVALAQLSKTERYKEKEPDVIITELNCIVKFVYHRELEG